MNSEANTPFPSSPSQPPNTPPQEPKKEDPGQILGILSLVSIPLGFPFVGVFLGYIGKKKSKEAGFDGSLSNIGFIICLILTILGIIMLVFFISMFGIFSAFFFDIIQKCQELGPGDHTINGATYSCGKE